MKCINSLQRQVKCYFLGHPCSKLRKYWRLLSVHLEKLFVYATSSKWIRTFREQFGIMHQMLKNIVHILGDNYNFSTKEIIGWAY